MAVILDRFFGEIFDRFFGEIFDRFFERFFDRFLVRDHERFWTDFLKFLEDFWRVKWTWVSLWHMIYRNEYLFRVTQNPTPSKYEYQNKNGYNKVRNTYMLMH